jgi:hypothetical protein
MTLNREPLSPQEIDQYFGLPAAPPAETFEIALVLGGTVSAGAYTAGVLDFLFEALDTWTAWRDGDDPARRDAVPRHKVVLKVIAGTSGGGVNAAIAARALAYDFPHVRLATPMAAGGSGNLFYDTWVRDLSLDGLLGTDDLARGKVASLLDGAVIDAAAAKIESFANENPRPARPYLADPLRLILTLTNMRGVPYRTNFGIIGGPLSETFVNHADFVRFALSYKGNAPADLRPDEFVLGFEGAVLPQMVDWPTLGAFAKATAAFPVGLPARDLVRPLAHYRYRVATLPDAGGAVRIAPLRADWDALIASGGGEQTDYRFFAVDGGATDNEPIALARAALCGVAGWNPRDGAVAQRAVLLIDPFAGRTDLGAERTEGLIADAGALVPTMLAQTRYDSSDILLAEDDSVFSRFMIAANRAGKWGDAAIASSGLMAFLGFAHEDFRRHDYLLGRANCQAFLKNKFVLPRGAKAFGSGWDGVLLDDYQVIDNGAAALPIIPLVGNCRFDETLPPWPQGALDPAIYRDAIERRFKGLVDTGVTGGLLTTLVTWLVDHLGEGAVADFVIGKIKQALDAADLS